MGLPRHRIALGLAATAAMLGAAWFATTRAAPPEVFAGLVPAEAPDAAQIRSGPLASSPQPSAPHESQRLASPSSERVPIADASAAPARSPRSFFERRGLGTLAGTLEIHSAARWPTAPEDSNLRLKIAPTTRIPEFEISGIFRGQMPLSSMLSLGEIDGVRRWSFDAGELPCGEYTLTVAPANERFQVTIVRNQPSYALLSLSALERVELRVLEDGAPCAAARSARYSPWATGSSGLRNSPLVLAPRGGTEGTFLLQVTAGERQISLDLGELGSLNRKVPVPAGGGTVTIDVTRRYAVELWIEDELGRSLRPDWAARATPTVVSGGAELQSRHAFRATSARPPAPEGDALAIGPNGAVFLDGDLEREARTPAAEIEPGPAVIWYFSAPGTVELTVVPQTDWGEPTTLTAAIGVGQPTRSTLHVRRPEPRAEEALDVADRLRLERVLRKLGR